MSFGQTLWARKDTKQALVTEQVLHTWNPIFGYLKSTKKGVKASQKLMKNLVQLAFNQFLRMVPRVYLKPGLFWGTLPVPPLHYLPTIFAIEIAF